ncbi:MAG: hypothetical protein IJB17_06265 [Oscillospiraceae bacterium]|nr:hypothetical protein [Oscillospiraceae bacterium]
MEYSFYLQEYHGSAVAQENWQELCARAQEELARLKRCYRVRGSERDEKMAVCAMAEALDYFSLAQNGLGGMQYASVGTVAVSGKGIYSQVDITPEAQAKELYRCALRYLQIYRGAVERL